MDDMQPSIVVGVSGSAASAAALRWAADEALRRHARLRVVRIWEAAEHRAPYATAEHTPSAQQRQAAASGGLQGALHEEFGSHTPEFVAAELAEGVPERVLVQRSAAADLLVLGSTTPASPLGCAAGPVVRTCLSRARCPVVVVRTAAGAPAQRWAAQPSSLSRA
jgi:nucleotide-binding universal stress UspA family protein